MPILIALLLFSGSVFASESIDVLEISENNVTLLSNIAKHPNLTVLTINCLENLKELPDSIGKLRKLKELKIDNGNGCSMNPVIPDSIGDLTALEKLTLYGAQDPRGKGPQPSARHSFPSAMSKLKKLVYLDLGRNALDEIPIFVKDLSHLKEFRFQWNMKLKSIPQFISNLRELTTLKLDSNGLEDLPDFLSTMPKLKFISLGNNCKITQSNTKMESLKKRFPNISFDFSDVYDCPSIQ